MKRLIVFIGLLAICYQVSAYKAAATFVALEGSQIQIIIDGKVINEQPKPKVSIIGRPGLHTIDIRIYDIDGNCNWEQEDCIQLNPGYKTHYKVYRDDGIPTLERQKMEPYSSKKLKNPEYYFNRKFYAYTNTIVFETFMDARVT